MLQGTQNQQRLQKINQNHTVGCLSTILHELDAMLYQREATKVTEEKRDNDQMRVFIKHSSGYSSVHSYIPIGYSAYNLINKIGQIFKLAVFKAQP